MKSFKISVLFLVLMISGCDSSTESGSAFNDEDVMFAQMMIPHHEQAIELVEMAENPATEAGPDLISLAAQIKNAQGPEINLMKNFLQSWDQPVSGHSSMGHGSTMKGILSGEELKKLSSLSGNAFEKEWLLSMTAHHEGAIEMAKSVERDGANSEVRLLAAEIISSQNAEIKLMKTMLAKL